MPFAQLCVGPPGSGKSTYCNGMSQILHALERRPYIINLDPANDRLPYEASIDIQDLISLDDVMREFQLGPNGGLLYCMQFILEHIQWLDDQIRAIDKWEDAYFILDLPGQVELFTDNEGFLVQLVKALEKNLNMRFCVVNLVDASHCTDAGRYISVVTLALRMMLCLEYPFVNILSKIDLLRTYDKLPFNLDFYTEVQDLGYLLQHLNADTKTSKYSKLNAALCELVGDFGLVSFYPVFVEDKKTMLNALRIIDKANGYAFRTLDESGNESVMEIAARTGLFEDVTDIQTQYCPPATADEPIHEEPTHAE